MPFTVLVKRITVWRLKYNISRQTDHTTMKYWQQTCEAGQLEHTILT
jgi:hypothetical protein